MFKKLYLRRHDGNKLVYRLDGSFDAPVSGAMKGLESIITDARRDQRQVDRHRHKVLNAALYLASVRKMQHYGRLPDGGYEHGINPLTFVPHRNYAVELNGNNKYLLADAKQELKNRYLKFSVNSRDAFVLAGLVSCVCGGVAAAHAWDNIGLGLGAMVPIYGAFLATGHYVSKFFRNRYNLVANYISFVPSKQ